MGVIVEAYHAPPFLSNILAIRVVSNGFETQLLNSVYDYRVCFLIERYYSI